MTPGQRANLLAIVNSERKVNYIKALLENQRSTPKHRWTKITPDPRFPQQNKDAPIIAIGATRPILAKDPEFYTSLLAGWSLQMMQGFQQIVHNYEESRSQRDSFLSDLINTKVGTPYPSMGSHFGKIQQKYRHFVKIIF